MESIPSKSLPEMPGDQSLHHAHTLDEHRSDCVQCDRLNGDENMVQCDGCQTWWHFSCAGVTDSIKDRSWSCPKCQVDDLGSIARTSRGSRCSNQSGRSARINLQLEKLNELQAIQQKFVEQKYKLLESQLELDEESESVRSKRSKVSKQASIAKVANWVKSCAEQKEDAIIPPTSTETGRPSLPPAPSNQPKPVTATASSYATAQVQQPDSGNQQSPLKHPSLPNQRSFGVLQRQEPSYPVRPRTETQSGRPSSTSRGVQIDDSAFDGASVRTTRTGFNKCFTSNPSSFPAMMLPPNPQLFAAPQHQLNFIPENPSTEQPFARPPSASVQAPPQSLVEQRMPEIPRPIVSHHQQGNLGPYHVGAPMPPMLHATSTLPPAAVPYRIPTYPVFQPMYQHAPPSGPAPTVGTLAAAPPAVASSYAAATPPSSPPPATATRIS
nr:leucine-rich repeat extensin-like protein 5 [Aedes albopictus]